MRKSIGNLLEGRFSYLVVHHWDEDVLTYMQNWVTFQERFNEILPMIPIYSNCYYDFYTGSLTNYSISENITWSQAIVPAMLAQ